MHDVIALDLEGTLISNAMSVFPRPGLHAFLERCRAGARRVVVFTAVKEERARWILEVLAREGSAPRWFERAEIVRWEGDLKDLEWIEGVDALERVFLVDDNEEYVAEHQAAQWVPIACWESPYHRGDRELERVWEVLSTRG